ncbi:aminopeptidase N [Paucibacter sp. DJ2R-2]|uniref:aminopeptidase N n=1 Tax=Paucibacter sp. DJ2R-2 TaxID=2893558 RepID=UPI0021E3B2A3|nr:aminopeptidase N [Paucibacter sp. DJ2R-2]MCV2422321.1 aminopeptidase N [Paucibacter sp. DJ4R-1]MCV2440527.1 aminopeptidase N [Paucibacter sp. DJ2R-2]
MREGTATLIRREDYCAPAFWIRTVDLTFDLDPAKTLVTSKMQLERNAAVAHGALRLHGEELNVLRVLINGESVSFRQEGHELIIDNVPDADFALEIRNTCAPDKNTALSGLYTSGGSFFTQCEAEGFRRITYFLDRPDVMAVYTVLLRADKAKFPVLLSNGNLLDSGDLDNGRHFAKWHDPFPKPSYLFALVAGDLVAREQRVRTRAGKDHLLQVFVRRGDLEKTEHAMNSLIASIVWDEARFGLPLDLERFMVVGVSDFNMGAMENKGLNIFNTSALLASPATATDADFGRIESIVAHEYFHNWTGNRVTCRDWFQLSLKEGLTVFRDQEFSMDMAGGASARAVCRIQDVRALRASQFPEDSGAMAHPVRPDTFVEINNFYTPTVYEKGSEVVRMYQTLVGRAGFEKGMKLYFERHDGQAVTCDDFAAAIADANPGSALSTRLDNFKRWYSQAGTPRVQARGVYDAAAQTYTLTLKQHNPATPGQEHKLPQVIPVALGLLSPEGQALPLQLQGEAQAAGLERVIVLDEAEQSFVFTNLASQPVPSLLRGFSAPVVLDDGLSDADLLVLLQHDADAFNRWEASQRLALNRILAAVRSGSALQLDSAFIEAMRAVLRHPELDAAFKDLALTLPGEGYIAEQLEVVDPQAIHAAVEAARSQLAQALRDDWAQAFEANQIKGGYTPDPVSSGKRALANLALSMLVLDAARSGDTVWPGRAYQRFKDAGNMTERLGALSALVNAHAELAEPALARFHELFKDDPLVIDKWFALQGRTPELDGKSFARVKQLTQHPDFTLKNPNRARSLIFSLCMFNPAAFHRADAAGYVFWAEQVLALDAINPQIASRLARTMDRWTTLAQPFRSAALEAIRRVAAKPDLSSDVREVIDRALESDKSADAAA